MYALIEIKDMDWIDVESMLEEAKGVKNIFSVNESEVKKIIENRRKK